MNLTAEKQIAEMENMLHRKLFEIFGNTENVSEEKIFAKAFELITNSGVVIPSKIKRSIVESTVHRITGLGEIEGLMNDATISEIMVNGKDDTFIEKNGKIEKSRIRFQNDENLMHIIQRIVSRIGKRIDESSPLVDARLPDGSRVNAIIPPLSLSGPVLTIRKFPENPMTMDNLLKFGSLNEEMAFFLWCAVQAKLNIIISGGTGSGKTSLLNACASMIPEDQRVITIEDAAEIRLTLPHLIRLESRAANIEDRGEIPIRQLLKNALRMRPDRIIVGEIRGGEALDMLQAMNTGHDGSLTTVHANAPLEALYRTETMVLMSNLDLPLPAIRNQITASIDILVQQERGIDGQRRITHISEVVKTRSTEYDVKDIYIFDRKKRNHRSTGHIPSALKRFHDYNLEIDDKFFKQK